MHGGHIIVTIQLPSPLCSPETRKRSSLPYTEPFDILLLGTMEGAQSRALQGWDLTCDSLCELCSIL